MNSSKDDSQGLNPPRSKLEWALYWAKTTKVFPLRPNEKEPACRKWQSEATNDTETIKALWKRNPDYNIGHSLSGNFFLLDLDVNDGKNGRPKKNGFQDLEELQSKYGRLPPTLTVESPSTGNHLYFGCAEKFPQRKAAFGIDTRISGSGYVVAAGSVINGIQYQIKRNLPVAQLPDSWIKAMPEIQKAASKKSAQLKVPVKSSHLKAAISYLLKAEPAITGNGGDTHTFIVAAKMGDFGLNAEEAFNVMAEYWNPRCLPPWDLSELRKKAESGNRNRQNEIGCSSPEKIFNIDDGEVPECVTELNKNHAVIMEGGQVLVLREQLDNLESPFQFLTESALKLAFRNQMVKVGTDKKTTYKSKADIFLESPFRRQYLNGAGLHPNGAPEGEYNLWQGPAVTPKKGKWPLFEKHLRDVVAGGHGAYADWLIKWIARMLQQPDEVGQVAVVLKGPQGTGKSIVGKAISTILGRHAMTVVNPRHLTGNFNQHLRHIVFLLAEEAFWAGSREAASALKVLITEERTSYEGKGKNLVSGKNNVHLMITSNEAQAVSADSDDRRYAIFDVQNPMAHKREYFDPLLKELNTGGLNAFLHDLLAMDLSSFNVFDKPKTQALAEEKFRSLRGVDHWLFEILWEGQLSQTECSNWESGAVTVSKTNLYEDYLRSSKAQREYRADSIILWRKRLNLLLGDKLKERRPRTIEGRQFYLDFAALPECREALRIHLKEDRVDWPESDQPRPKLSKGADELLS